MKKSRSFIFGFIIGALIFSSFSAIAADLVPIEAKINKSVRIMVDGELKETEKPVIFYQGNNYVSLREAFEMLHAGVDWIGEDQIIDVTSPEKLKEIKEKERKEEEGSKTEEGDKVVEEIYYQSVEVGDKLKEVNGKTFSVGGYYVTYEGKRYDINGRSFYNDFENKSYLREDLLLEFLDSSILDGLPKYSIDREEGTTTKIE